jgi:hypothetical protein
MPNVDGLRKLLPLIIWSDEWQHCGKRGITIDKALGKSQWTLLAECNTCKQRLTIYKRGVMLEKKKR